MIKKLLLLALAVLAETLVGIVYMYLTKKYGPLGFNFRMTPDVDLRN